MAKIVSIELDLKIEDEDADNIFLEDTLKELFEDLLYDYTDSTIVEFNVSGVVPE